MTKGKKIEMAPGPRGHQARRPLSGTRNEAKPLTSKAANQAKAGMPNAAGALPGANGNNIGICAMMAGHRCSDDDELGGRSFFGPRH